MRKVFTSILALSVLLIVAGNADAARGVRRITLEDLKGDGLPHVGVTPIADQEEGEQFGDLL